MDAGMQAEVQRIDTEASRCGCKAKVIGLVRELFDQAKASPNVYPETMDELNRKLQNRETMIRYAQAMRKEEHVIGDRLVCVSLETYGCGKRRWHASIGWPMQNGAFRCMTVRDGVISGWIVNALELPAEYASDVMKESRVWHYDWLEPLLS